MTKKLQKYIALFIRRILVHENLRYFTFNLLMGIIIFIALSLIQTTQFVEDLLNPVIDKLISNESKKAVQLYMECLRTTQKACDAVKKKLQTTLSFLILTLRPI